MKKFVGEAIKLVIALFIVIAISCMIAGVEFVILKIGEYAKVINLPLNIDIANFVYKTFLNICIVIAVFAIAKGITINYFDGKKEPKGVYKLLAKWRKERNITNADTKVYVQNVLEELLEIYYKDKDFIKASKEGIYDSYFGDEVNPISEINTIDSICDIQVFSINEVEQMKYNNKKCMLETIKEISSREQDQLQKEDWEKYGAIGKWQKNQEQSKDTLYVANYQSCKA